MVLATALSYVTLLTLAAAAVYILWAVYNRFSDSQLEEQFKIFDILKDFLNRNSREIAFVIALTATLGSLYFSNILGWTPCRLCWYQRIMMYPLVIVLGVGLLFEKKDVADYALPMSLIGAAVSTYHYPIQRIAELHSTGCSQMATSCDMTYTAEFGFISIPLMAWAAFLAIIILLWRFSER
jgi:disulfide bond formation protein DsbB